jgi:hypothetical protein
MTGSGHEEKKLVVLDKSFAEGAKPYCLKRLGTEYSVLVTSHFYFEVFTTLDTSRIRVFAGFPDFRRVDTCSLLKCERESGAPAITVQSVLLELNPGILSGEKLLSRAEQQCIERFEASQVNPQVVFWKNVMQRGVLGFDNAEVTAAIGSKEAFVNLGRRLHKIDFIRMVAGKLNMRFADKLDERWFTFRKLQAMLLHGLSLRYFYPNEPRKDLDLEHDVHDIDYLALGLHAGCLATNESLDDHRKLGWRFKYLCPTGNLLQARTHRGESSIVNF